MRRIFACLIVYCCLVPLVATGSEQIEITDVLPDMKGWVRDGDPQKYFPQNLYEYINGAAEVYLSYNFQELATLTYDNDQEQSITIEVYRHSTPNNGFGIYSQEKLLKSNFLEIGTQGHCEEGFLNFFSGEYYVKLLSFGLGDEGQSFLIDVAKDIVKKLPAETGFPKPVLCFPEKGKVAHSERYIAKNFLGHSFLHSAFIADYNLEDEQFRLFIIEAVNSDEAEEMMKKYRKLLEKNSVIPAIKDGVYRFRDPYFNSQGMMNLKMNEQYIWGLFSDDRSVSEYYLNIIEENMTNQHLIK